MPKKTPIKKELSPLWIFAPLIAIIADVWIATYLFSVTAGTWMTFPIVVTGALVALISALAFLIFIEVQ